MKVRLTVST